MGPTVTRLALVALTVIPFALRLSDGSCRRRERPMRVVPVSDNARISRRNMYRGGRASTIQANEDLRSWLPDHPSSSARKERCTCRWRLTVGRAVWAQTFQAGTAKIAAASGGSSTLASGVLLDLECRARDARRPERLRPDRGRGAEALPPRLRPLHGKPLSTTSSPPWFQTRDARPMGLRRYAHRSRRAYGMSPTNVVAVA
jgi:hypothetical protein